MSALHLLDSQSSWERNVVLGVATQLVIPTKESEIQGIQCTRNEKKYLLALFAGFARATSFTFCLSPSAFPIKWGMTTWCWKRQILRQTKQLQRQNKKIGQLAQLFSSIIIYFINFLLKSQAQIKFLSRTRFQIILWTEGSRYLIPVWVAQLCSTGFREFQTSGLLLI